MLIGHAAPQAAFLDAWRSGRMHHAWLLAGPEGVGKRTFADLAALMLMAGADGLSAPTDHPAARLVAAGSHPDLRVVERAERVRGGGQAAAITVDQVRDLQPLFQMTPALADWRAVVFDSVDDLNIQAANALLKNLEEPPQRTLFLLVSHAPGRLLPTIRSRCRRLRFGPLSDADTRGVLLRALPEAEGDELDELTSLADGAPGRAAAYAGLKVGELTAALDRLAHADGAPARAAAAKLSALLAGKAAQPRYEAFLDLAPRRLAAEARAAAAHPKLPAILGRWEEAAKLAADAGPLSLDPAMVAAELARLVAGSARR
jgi:DNA polymerase-3 subunit delta'